jgi:hypothetical protein
LVEQFYQPAFTTIKNVEHLFEEAAKGNPTTSLEFVKKLYGGDLDVQWLQMLPNIGDMPCNNISDNIKAVGQALKTGGTVIERMLSEVIILLEKIIRLSIKECLLDNFL